MISKNTAASVDVNELIRENERLKSNVKYLETHYRRLEAFVNSAPFLVYIKNSERQYTMFNALRERQFNLSTDDILWHTDLDLAGNSWGALSHEQDGRAIGGQTVESLESSPRADDGLNWLVVRFPFVDAEGERYIGAVGLDISQHKAA